MSCLYGSSALMAHITRFLPVFHVQTILKMRVSDCASLTISQISQNINLQEAEGFHQLLWLLWSGCEGLSWNLAEVSIQFSSVTQLCLTLHHPMDHSMPGLPVHHQLLEFTQIHVHWVSDAIQPSHPLSSPCPPALNLSRHQGLFQWVSSSHQVAKVLEFQLQHQSFQWSLRTDLP